MDHLLNWLWQGALVMLGVAVWLSVTGRRASAGARYRVTAIALSSVLCLPLLALRPSFAGTPVVDDSAATAPALVSLPDSWWTSNRVVFALWTIWILLVGIRAIASVVALGRARAASRPFPAALEAQLSRWYSLRDRGRSTRLVLSDAIRTAAVFGGRQPLIAVHPRLADALTPDDLDRVVVHEWAHVQRHDDLARLVQLAIHIVAGWHPAVYGLARQLHFEREVACDERAVALTGSARAYAGCLLTLAGFSATNRRALPVVDATPGTHLRRRVTRVLAFGSATPRWAQLAMGCAGAVPLAIAIGVADVRVVASMSATVVAETTLAVRALIPQDIVVTVAAVAPDIPRLSRFAADRRPAAQPSTQAAGRPLLMAVRNQHRPATPEVDRADQVPVPTPNGDGEPGASLAAQSRWTFTTLRESPHARPSTSTSDSTATADPPTLWGAAATGGKAIGRGSQIAAVSTAGFFTRLGKSIAGSF